MIKVLSFTAFSIITHRYRIEYGNHNSRFIQWVIYELQVNFYLGVVRTTQVLYKELVSSTGLKVSDWNYHLSQDPEFSRHFFKNQVRNNNPPLLYKTQKT